MMTGEQRKKEGGGLGAEFRRQAADLSAQFGLDPEDVARAYGSKPESLSALFNIMEDAASRRRKCLIWSAVALVFATPLAVWPGYFVYRHHRKLDWVRETVVREMDRTPALPPPSPGRKLT